MRSPSLRSVCPGSSASSPMRENSVWSIGTMHILPIVGLLADWHHCPRCGAPVASADGRAECAACGYVAYANPAPAACALCVDDAGRILLTRRAWEPYAGMWDLPGGFLGEGEHPLEALHRALREETGREVEPTAWFGAFMTRYGDEPGARHVLNLVWEVHVTG